MRRATPTKSLPARLVRVVCWCALLAGGAIASPARAALGDDVAVVEQDRARMHASAQVRRLASYQVHELVTPTGVTVREFVGETGKVFAVTWSGGWRPDLRHILGSHYGRFVASRRGQRRARGTMRAELPGLVVVMGGYLRTSFGHAYLPEQLPAGFSLQDLE